MHILCILLILFCTGNLFAVMNVSGFIGQERVEQLLKEIEKSPEHDLTIVIQSQSGEIIPVMNLARALYARKLDTKAKVTVYINEEALGPSAVLVFLADELYISPTATWGAIVSHKQSDIPLNILRSRVHGLIEPSQRHYNELLLLASAMIDADVQLSKGLKQVFTPKEGEELVTKNGETLVLNQTQIQEYGLCKEVLSPKQFLKEEEPAQATTALPKQSDFEDRLKQFVHFSENEPKRVGYIPLIDRDKAISEATWIYINRALAKFKENPPSCIILELNSPGGEVFAAERISDALKEMDTQLGVPVICYINNWAISAGAMLAYSCRFIVAAKDASMGAAEPITMGGEGKAETASEKVNSALRSDFANRAQYFGRNPFLAEAMVDKDILLVRRHGKIIKLDSANQIRQGGLDPDEIISPKGKLLTLNTNQLIEYQVADYVIKPEKLKRLTIDEEEKGVWPIEKSALGQISFLKGATIEAYQMDWQTQVLAFLASPSISSLLLMVLMVSIYIELSSGGFGLAGAVGLISLFLVLLSSFALEAIHWLEPILLLFGLFLIALELFFFPTLGILGVVGAIFALVGLAGMMLPGLEHVSYEGDGINVAGQYVLSRLTWLAIAFLAALAIIGVLSRFMWPKIGLVKKIVLTDDMRSQAGLHGSLPPSKLTALPKVGESAIVVSALRPAGKIQIGDDVYDAVSTGSFLLEGTQVTVVRIEGQKILVEESYT